MPFLPILVVENLEAVAGAIDLARTPESRSTYHNPVPDHDGSAFGPGSSGSRRSRPCSEAAR